MKRQITELTENLAIHMVRKDSGQLKNRILTNQEGKTQWKLRAGALDRLKINIRKHAER